MIPRVHFSEKMEAEDRVVQIIDILESFESVLKTYKSYNICKKALYNLLEEIRAEVE